MGEHQCPHCGHITTGFEQQDFEAKQHEIECLRAALGTLASCAAVVMQTNQAGNEPDFVPLLNAYHNATKLLPPRAVARSD